MPPGQYLPYAITKTNKLVMEGQADMLQLVFEKVSNLYKISSVAVFDRS